MEKLERKNAQNQKRTYKNKIIVINYINILKASRNKFEENGVIVFNLKMKIAPQIQIQI